MHTYELKTEIDSKEEKFSLEYPNPVTLWGFFGFYGLNLRWQHYTCCMWHL